MAIDRYSSHYEFYLAARHRGSLAAARRLDSDLDRESPVSSFLTWSSRQETAYSSAAQFAQFDRELRRATAIVRAERRVEFPPSPVSLSDGGLSFREARVGSLEFALDAFGLVAMVLLSDPVQLLLTTQALLGKAVRVRAWLENRGDPLSGVSARGALAVLKEFERYRDTRTPSRVIEPRRRISSQHPPEDHSGGDASLVDVSDDRTVVKGSPTHRIHVFRQYPDGRVDLISIEPIIEDANEHD